MVRMVTRVLLFALFSAVAAWAQAVTDDGSDARIRQAESLIQSGDSEKAYALLEPLETEQAGNVLYDYLLGVSAVNSGKFSRAVFALERVQAVNPDYRNVRLWLAIAYYKSGDRERARAGLGQVASTGDADARESAKRYLAIMDEEDAARHGSLTGKLDIGFGYDNNITNLSPGYASVQQYAAAVPAPATDQSGAESILGLGLEGRYPSSSGYWFVTASDERRGYIGNRNMDSNTVIARAGINTISGRNVYRFNVMQRQFRQLGTYYNMNSLTNDYIINALEGSRRHQLTENSYLGLYAQYSQVRFDVNNLEDTNQLMAGLSYMRQVEAKGRPVINLGYAHFFDQAVRQKNSFNPAVNEGLTDAGKDTDVATLFLQYSIGADVDLVSTNYYYFRRDTGAYARSATVAYGIDKISYVSLGDNWRFRPKWSMRTLLAKTDNRSNIAAYSYSKTEATVVLRRDFN